MKIATIGTSIITRKFAAAVALVPSLELAGAYSRSAERAAVFASEIGAPEGFASLGKLFASGVESVYVGTPNGTHGEIARVAIDAGVHVFLEKPAVPDSTRFEELVRRAEDRNVVLFEGMRNVHDPGFKKLKSLLPKVGIIRAASFQLCQRSSRYDSVLAGGKPNIFDPALEGGALWDLGVYCLSAMVDLFGQPEDLSAAQVPVPTGVDGIGRALLRYPGFLGEVCYSKITTSSRPSEIQGELGTLLIDSITAPRHLTFEGNDGVREYFDIPGEANNLVYEIKRFTQLVEGADASMDTARTLAVLRLAEEISGRTHQ